MAATTATMADTKATNHQRSGNGGFSCRGWFMLLPHITGENLGYSPKYLIVG